MLLCLKRSFNRHGMKILIDDLNPSCLRKWLPSSNILSEIIDGVRPFWYLLNCVRHISFVYIEITKDFLITYTLIIHIGGFDSLIEYPRVFTSAGVMSLLCSIIIPLVLSSARLAKNNPEMIYGDNFGKMTKRKQILWKIGIILMSIFIPAILFRRYQKNKDLLNFQDSKKKKYFEDVDKIGKRVDNLKLQYVKFIRTVFGFPVIIHIKTQLILLLKSITNTCTVNGLGKVQYFFNCILRLHYFDTITFNTFEDR